MDAQELKRRIARLKREKKEEEERRELRGVERGAIAEAREAKRERRIAGIGLAVEKAKVYKALPLPHISRRDEEERVRRAEERAEKAEAKATREISMSERRMAATRAKSEAAEAERKQRAEETESRKARMLTERELRAERMRPYREAASRTAKGVGVVGRETGKVAIGLAKIPVGIIKQLGEESRKYAEAHPESKQAARKPERGEPYKEPPLDFGIDLGI